MESLEFNTSVFKRKLKEAFNVLDQENEYKRLQEGFVNDVNEAIASAYGIDKGEGLKGRIAQIIKINARINENSQEVNLGTFKNADGVEVKLIFTRDQLIKKWMELQDPTLTEAIEEGNKFTLKIIEAIDKALDKKDKAFALKQFELYKKQWKKINPIYRKFFGANLPFNEFYSPIAKEGFQIDTAKGFGTFMHDATTRIATTSKSFITRVKNKFALKTQGSMDVLQRHMKETNYFIAWAERLKTFDRVFRDANVREAIKQEFTSQFLGSIDNTLDDLSTNGNKWAKRYKVLDFFRTNFTLGKLMLKPSIFAKQLVSTLAYLEKVNPVEFVVGVVDFWSNPLGNYKILQKESVFIRQRGSNQERDIKELSKSDTLKQFSNVQGFINLLMLNVKAGDKLAIVMGSWALRKSRLAQGEKSLPDIIREYENFSQDTQQSSDISRLSEVQRGGSFEKLFTMFKSSMRQYLAKELNAVKSLFQKDGTSPANIKKVVRVMAIYHFILPMAFQYLANFGGWDEEDRKNILRAGILGSLNGLFIFGDVVDSIIRKALKLRVFDNELPISQVADAILRGLEKLDVEDITSEEVFAAMIEFIEAGDSFGIPVSTVKNMAIGVQDIMDGDIREGVAEIMGWSPRSVENKDEF